MTGRHFRSNTDRAEQGRGLRACARLPCRAEEGRQGAHKFLVYDGQQRLQTLRSVLYYAFNGRVLHFDLLFDDTKEYADETGFVFRDKDKPPEPRSRTASRLSKPFLSPKSLRLLEQSSLRRKTSRTSRTASERRV
jgi:hypothetical protein